jgi:hypothetical protein
MAEISNHLGEALEAAGTRAAYDANAKELMADKTLIAEIVKRLFPEFANIPTGDIPCYIEGSPLVGQVEVAPNKTNRSVTSTGAVRGVSQEVSSDSEGKTTFDVFFKMQLPQNDGIADVFINIEAQNNEDVDYPLERRAAYYAARMVSSQYQREFSHAHYEEVKKAYSIWVVVNPKAGKQNTISSYQMHQEMVVGNIPDNHEYDIMQIFMIRLGSDYTDKRVDRLIRMLTAIFSTLLDAEKKKKILTEDFQVPVTEKLEKELNEMCNLSQGIVDKTVAATVAATTAEHAIGMRDAGATDEFIAKALKLSLEEVQAILEAYQGTPEEA